MQVVMRFASGEDCRLALRAVPDTASHAVSAHECRTRGSPVPSRRREWSPWVRAQPARLARHTLCWVFVVKIKPRLGRKGQGGWEAERGRDSPPLPKWGRPVHPVAAPFKWTWVNIKKTKEEEGKGRKQEARCRLPRLFFLCGLPPLRCDTFP